MITKRLTAISTLIFGGALGFGSSIVKAQTFGLEYTTEWQTDFKGGYDWLNLLQASTNVTLSNNIVFEATTISTAKSGDYPLIEDLLTYSNIEAGNIPLTFSRLGFNFTIGGAELFAGINNVNEDYFTSDLTSFFTNSSCGITPTISCNFDIANYPVASWCLHYRQQFGSVALQSSLYPGKGYYRLAGHENIFSFNLKKNGILSISSIDYNRNGINTVMGVALHYGVCIADEEGESEETKVSAQKKTFSASPWVLTEIALPSNLGLLAHASYSTAKNGCQGYAGVGLVYNGRRVQPGISCNYAHFSEAKEFSTEISCIIPIVKDQMHLQPALHLISDAESKWRTVGLFRICAKI